VAALNLLRLDWMLGDVAGVADPGTGLSEAGYRASCRERAVKTIEALRPQWTAVPQGLPQLLCAIELVVDAPRTVVLVGDPATAEFQALAAVLAEPLGPRRALLGAAGGAGQQWLAARRPYLAEMKPVDGRATAYVCENFTCQAPVNTPEKLRTILTA
jgi:uncharacterized protein YyaL (SSP411 family)